ncbi:MAG: hypothetical protein Q8M98_07835 [Candidatus Cloacimonadaceae bacterium]|nr:hypothetical protein [Candidatus Cloacimonadaceae bacterium]
MDMIFGQGNARFERGGVIVNLGYSYGRLSFADSVHDVETLKGTLLRFYKGSRAKIKTVLNNSLNESGGILTLMQILNAARQDHNGIMVYPNYQGISSPGYLCNVPVEFDPEWLSLVGGGQKIELNWESVERLDNVPAYSSSSTVMFLWTIHNGQTMTEHNLIPLEFKA